MPTNNPQRQRKYLEEAVSVPVPGLCRHLSEGMLSARLRAQPERPGHRAL